MVWIFIFILAVAVDQISKYIIISNIEIGKIIPVIDKFFYLTHIKNKGAAWGMLQNGRYFFIILTIIVCIVLVYLIKKSRNKFLKFSLTLIISGGVGNLIDRVLSGSVTDFFGFNFGTYSFPIFNIADMCGVIGTILLMIYLIFFYKEPKNKSKAGIDE